MGEHESQPVAESDSSPTPDSQPSDDGARPLERPTVADPALVNIFEKGRPPREGKRLL